MKSLFHVTFADTNSCQHGVSPYSCYAKRVIPYQFTEGSHMTLSDLDEIRFVGSPSGHI